MFTPLGSSDELRWLDDAACADLEISDFFVDAGHVISEDVLEICRSCPVRRECVTHAVTRGIVGGYFGGISPGQRRDMKTVEDAFAYIENDPPKEVPEILDTSHELVQGLDPKVVGRLRGLLLRAHASSTSEEAEAYRQKAEDLAHAHNLELSELQSAGVA